MEKSKNMKLNNLAKNNQPAGPKKSSNRNGPTVPNVKKIGKLEANPRQLQNNVNGTNAQKKKSPVEIFAERVTIAGLQEAYDAKSRTDRIMFRGALLVAFALIIYEIIKMGSRYGSVETIFVDLELINYQAPFPNISVCFTTVLDYDLIERYVPRLSPKLKESRQRHRIDQTVITNYVRKTLLMEVQATDVDTDLYLLTRESYDAILQDLARREGKSLMLETIRPSCPQILSNCAFEGRPFDCCEFAEFLTVWENSCFQIRFDHVIIDKQRDPIQLKQTGLTFDVNKNWTFGSYDDLGSASDGYHVFIDALPAPSKVPAHVPADMDVLIQLGQPKEIKETSGCRLNKMQKMKYFKYDDTAGTHCMGEMIIDEIYKALGCYFPSLSHFPLNESCTFAQNFFISVVMSSSNMKELKEILSGNIVSAKAKNQNTDPFEIVRFLYSSNSPCLPLCSRWEYPVLSASYGAIKYKDVLEEQKQLMNRSWSRIRVILPQSSSSHSEERKAASYLAMCDIGGMMGVYAGFSMITFAQIGAYGFLICRAKLKKRRNNKVQPE